MGLSVLTFSDEPNGRRFQRWVDEFAYAMGADCNFEEVASLSQYEVVVALICLPPDLADFGTDGISLKRGSKELWSTRHANFEEFVSGQPERMIACIDTAFREAVRQIPDRHLSDAQKGVIQSASEKAAESLNADPDRLPR